MSESKKYLVLWSGGFDSTLLLHQLLRDGAKVRTIAVNHHQIYSRTMEKWARGRIRSKLASQGLRFEHNEITHSGRKSSVSSDGSMQQQLVWLSSAVLNLRNEETFAPGFIAGDDVWHFRSWYVDSFHSMVAVSGKDGCGIEFPLEWWSKWEVIRDIKKARLASLCWYCEKPVWIKSKKVKACGQCASCVRVNVSRYELKLRSKQE